MSHCNLIGEEKDLANTCMLFARGGFPLTETKLRKLAFQLGQANRRYGFSPTKKIAGRKWLRGFLDRNPVLNKKVAFNLSLHRAQCANPAQVEKWFDLYESWVDKWDLKFKPFQIWNIDETGLADVPKERRVIGVTGEHTSQTVSGEQGELTTILTYASAGGTATKPMVIFKAAKVNPAWREAAPTGYMVRNSQSGYISSKLFAEYGHRFVEYLKANQIIGRPPMINRIQGRQTDVEALLLLDAHKSHLFNWDFMSTMKKNKIEVCCFPPHTTHMIQPLDDIPFAMLKQKWQTALQDFNYSVGGRKISRVEFIQLLIPVYTQSITLNTIRAGYERTGIYPPNRQAKKIELMQLKSHVTDRNMCKFSSDTYAVVSPPDSCFFQPIRINRYGFQPIQI